uniref:ABC transporter domain-containing protein n=1 Tax=Bacillus cereus HuA4-10 TaxID=1053206 RepID=J8DE07_BACCE|nr:hypothetical protein IGC_04926 [Bacillus cereus HuA4-10]
MIELKNVTKKFKDFTVKNIDLQVNQGFVAGFIGANGAGKSTIIKIMINLLKLDAGDVKVFWLNRLQNAREGDQGARRVCI